MIIGCAPYLSTEYRLPSQWSTLQNPKKNIKIKFNTTQNTHVSTFPVRLPCKSEQLLLRNPKRPFRSLPSTNSWSESKPTTLHRQCALSNPNYNSTSRNARKYKPLEPKFTETRNSKSPKEKMSRASKFKPALGGRGLEIRDPTAAIASAREKPPTPLSKRCPRWNSP